MKSRFEAGNNISSSPAAGRARRSAKPVSHGAHGVTRPTTTRILSRALGMSISLGRIACFVALPVAAASSSAMAQTNEVITFEKAEITGRWVDAWDDKGVTFTPAHAPVKSKAKAKLMFFPHAPSGRKGILSAVADDPIPVRATFTNGCSAVSLSLWGSTDCAARLEAYNAEGQLVDKTVLEKIPGRQAPGEPIPTFQLTVKGTNISYIEFGGPRPGEYLVAEEVRFVPLVVAGK